jgi:hypothetical protein
MAEFPTFIALKINVKYTVSFATEVQAAKSLKETRTSYTPTAVRRWELEIDRLSENDPVQGNELNTLLAFFAARRGRYDAFTFTDPISNSPVNVRFDTDELKVQRVVNQRWQVSSLPLVEVI